MPACAERVELGGDEVDDGVRVVRRRADRHDERAGIGEADPFGDDRVGEAPILPDLLEQPRRDAPAEHVVQQREGEPARRTSRRRPHAENEVRLLRVARRDVDRPHFGGRSPAGRRDPPGDAGETAGETVADAPVVDLAGRRDDDVRRSVVDRQELADLVDRHGLDDLGIAEDLPTERVGREQRVGEALLGDVRRLVEVHEHLLEDHLTFRVDLVRAQRRIPDDVGEDVERRARGRRRACRT